MQTPESVASSWAEPDEFRIHVLLSELADPKMRALAARLLLLARDRMPVLVTGESGAGKEVVARALHQRSPRARGPSVAINCGAFPSELIETELFGYEKGAFTGASSAKPGLLETAHGGTILLDEIGEMPLALQSSLLRFLDDGSVRRVGGTACRASDARVVAATNRDLSVEVSEKRFRQDLFFRISGATLHVPPLRERPADVPVLAQILLDRAREDRSLARVAISPEAIEALLARSWPGNIRELNRSMELLAITASEPVVLAEHLPEEPFSQLPSALAAPSRSGTLRAKAVRGARQVRRTKRTFMPIAEEISRLEKRRMVEALELSGGNARLAARLLQMPRRSFVRKTQLYGIRRA